jgi:hypothetical protein
MCVWYNTCYVILNSSCVLFQQNFSPHKICYVTYRKLVVFEVLTAVVTKNTIFWNVTPCSPSACHLLSLWFLALFSLRTWRWRRYVHPKRLLNFNGLHSVISQMIVIFIISTWFCSVSFSFICKIYRYARRSDTLLCSVVSVVWLHLKQQVDWIGIISNDSDMYSEIPGSNFGRNIYWPGRGFPWFSLANAETVL